MASISATLLRNYASDEMRRESHSVNNLLMLHSYVIAHPLLSFSFAL